MEHISKFLAKRIKQSGFSQQVKTSLVIGSFNELAKEMFGQRILKKMKALYIKDKVLTIACLSSVMAQELNFKKAEIIEKINKKLSEKSREQNR